MQHDKTGEVRRRDMNNHSRRTYVLYGAFGGFNAGDEIILRASAAGISEVDPTASFVVLPLSKNVRPETIETYARLGWPALSLRRPIELLLSLHRSALVIAGGQLLNGRKFPLSLIFLLALALASRCLGGKVIMIGVGTRLVSQYPFARAVARALAQTCALITVRDASSVADLVSSGVPANSIRLTSDVAWSYVKFPVNEPDRSKVVVAVHRDPGESHIAEGAVLDLVRELVEVLGDRQIVLAAHDCREKFDAGLLKNLESRLPEGCTTAVLQSADDALALYADAALVISSRMHPLIIGLASGAQIMPMVASSKVSDLTTVLEIASSVDANESPRTIAICAAAVLNEGSGFPTKDTMEKLRQDSRLNFTLLVKNAEIAIK